MFVYNVTIKIDLNVHDIWLRWMKEIHIPNVMSTGCFKSHKLYRIMEENQVDGMSYAIQYFTENLEDYFRYKEQFSPALQKESLDAFPNQFQAFRTILREV